MTDLMIRLEDEDAWTVLDLQPDDALAIDVIGVVRMPIDQWREDGSQVMRRVPGFHVNLRCFDDRDLSALDPFIVTPEQPARVWF